MRKLHVNEALREALFKLSVAAYAQGDYMIKSFSGADQADSEKYYGMGRVYCNVARGQELEFAIAAEDKRWRAYAEENHKKVNEAPKIKRGPSSGQSVLSHRWVQADAFTYQAIHIRQMVSLERTRHPNSTEPRVKTRAPRRRASPAGRRVRGKEEA